MHIDSPFFLLVSSCSGEGLSLKEQALVGKQMTPTQRGWRHTSILLLVCQEKALEKEKEGEEQEDLKELQQKK